MKKSICTYTPCGDGELSAEEDCDIQIVLEGCTLECKEEIGWKCIEGTCSVIFGDGIRIKPYEECDDGNLENFDGCSGSMTVEAGFQCYSKADD